MAVKMILKKNMATKNEPSATDVMLAHQYLYYVAARPIWTDYEYDQFCNLHGLDGSGGSGLADKYPERVKQLAQEMLGNHSP